MNSNERSVAFVRGEQLPTPLDLMRYDFDQYQSVDQEVDLRSIWSILYRNRYLILAVLAMALLAGTASILLTEPVYRAKASVQIDQQPVKVLGTEDSAGSSAQEADRFLQTQVDILTSRSLAERVAERLRLASDDKFLQQMGYEPNPEASQNSRRRRVLGIIQKNLLIELPSNSRIVTINFDGPNPNVAAAVANSYTDNYIASNLQRRFDTSTYSREFLQDQLTKTKGRLEMSERALIGYARSARLVDASAGSGGGPAGTDQSPRSLTTSNLVDLNQAYAAARTARVQAQQRWAQAQSTPVMSLPEVLGNGTVNSLMQKRAELQAAYELELQRRQPEHPAVRQAAAQIKELDRQINTVAASIKNSLREQYLVAQSQENALQGNVGQLKNETLSEQDRGIRYNILKREVDTNRQLYDGLLQRYKEISAEAGVTNNNISVVDKAEPPTSPVSPRPVLNMAVAGMGGLALALLLAFAREKFDDVIRSPEDIDQKLSLSLLGVVPLLKSRETPQLALADARSGMSEAHYALRTALELSTGDGVPSTLLLTSSRQGEGKSTSAYAMARDFANAGRRTLLIDADLRKPSLHRLLGLPNGVGLSTALAKLKHPDEVIQATGTPNLDFIASGPLPPNPAHLLGSSTLLDVLSYLEARYDLVVIDGPPVLGLADAPRLGAAAKGTIFVIEANGAHSGSAKAALKRLMESGANLVGAVLTKFDAKQLGYSDDYGYYTYRYEDKSGNSNADQDEGLALPQN